MSLKASDSFDMNETLDELYELAVHLQDGDDVARFMERVADECAKAIERRAETHYPAAQYAAIVRNLFKKEV